MKFLDGFGDQAYAILRIMAGLMFVQHGTQKLLNFPSDYPYDLNAMSMAAGGIELVLGLAIAIGLFTRFSAFLSSGMCAVGYWMVHGMNDIFPINNGGELIALYCFTFLFIATKGAGIWSADSMMGNSSDG